MSSEIRNARRHSVFPDDCMGCAHIADGNTTSAGDADDLSLVVNRCRCAGRVTWQRRQFSHLAVGFPERGAELQDLKRRIATRVMNSILRPTNYLSAIIVA